MINLNELNPAQREAALHSEGPLLVVAGAGAGKTKTVTYRIGRLIESGVEPERILAITFTNKAAKEMRDRVLHLLSEAAKPARDAVSQPFVSTFHALGVHILRESGRAIGLNKYFSILDKDDSLSLVKELLKERGIESKEVEPRRVLAIISREKGNLVTVEKYLDKAETSRHPLAGVVAQIWPLYEKTLRARQALDFDDLLLKTVLLLKQNQSLLEHYQHRWQYLHIDEYQDTNSVQYELARLLADKHRNLCVVGDVDQSIYSWRGADFKNLLRFEKDYTDAKVVLLEENYRSTKTILAAANQVISKNSQRHEKNLYTNKADGENIELLVGLDEGEESALIAEKITSLITEGHRPSDMAVLYRTNFQSRAIEEALLRAGLPYQVLGTKFFDRQEVKDVLAMIKAALNPADWESQKRIINVPPRGIGKVTLAKMAAGLTESLPDKTKSKIAAFQQMLREIKQAAETKIPSDLIKFVLRHSGLEAELKSGNAEDAERLANLQELATLALKYDQATIGEGVWQMLTDAALVSDQDSLEEGAEQAGKAKKTAGVRLMTIHASKGLEFDHVFVSGLEQGLFPSIRLGDDSQKDSEEERRLFYVALTRARERLFLSYAQIRTIFGSRQVNLPSEFLADIDDSLINTGHQSLISIDF